MPAADYWNHNVAYHPLVLDAVPARCGEALDVGCGEGLLARRLAARAERVTGVDRSAEMIRLARHRSARLDNLSFVELDVTDDHDQRLVDGRYDFVSAVAVVHHLDFVAALGRFARLLSPGGRLAIVGLARDATPWDWAASAAGVPAARWSDRRRGGATDPAGMPVAEPAMAWGEVRDEARRLLPGCRFRRHLLWRYSLVWGAP